MSGWTSPVDSVDPAFGHWLAGYIGGEGSFTTHVHQPGNGVTKRMSIATRADEYPLLQSCRDQMGLGALYFSRQKSPTQSGSKPTWRWIVSNNADCLKLIDFLSKYPLRSKKK